MRHLAAVGALLVVAMTVAASSAAAHPVYMECDRAISPDYPAVLAAPHKCNLELNASYYDVQPLLGRSFGPIGLREIRWYDWGQDRAMGHGLACNIYWNGGTKWGQCAHVTVKAFRPESIGPAGGAYIYQRTVVSRSSFDRWRRFTFWYEPGTDY